jgi:hypothetical protein
MSTTRRGTKHSGPLHVEIGRVYGRLTIQGHLLVWTGEQRRTLLLCTCRCGQSVRVAPNSLRRGLTRSCGCYRTEMLRQLCRTRPPRRGPGRRQDAEA